MEQQKEKLTLIRLHPLGNNEIGLQFAGNSEWVKCKLDNVSLRLAVWTFKKDEASVPITLPNVIDFFSRRLSLPVSHISTSNSDFVDRGPASRLIGDIKEVQVERIGIECKDFAAATMQWPTSNDLGRLSKERMCYVDIEPRSLRDVVENNLKTFGAQVHFATPCQLEMTKEQQNQLSGRTFHDANIFLRFLQKWIALALNLKQIMDISNDVSFGFCIDKVVPKADIVFHTQHQTLIPFQTQRQATLHVNLVKAMEIFTNQRWSVTEFGLPLSEQMRDLLRLASFVASTVHCPLEVAFERGRLAITTGFMDLCLEQSNILPYSAVVYFTNRRGAQKRERQTEEDRTSESYQGGHVMDSVPGIYVDDLNKGYLALLDFDSYYPSIILEWALFYKRRLWKDDVSPFHSHMNSLLGMKRTKLFPKLIPPIKLVMNGVYGCWGSSSTNVGNKELASIVTQHGREQIQRCRALCESTGARVLMGHTDAVLIYGKSEDISTRICEEINHGFEKICLRPSQFFSLCWVINKTHHVSLVRGVIMSDLVKVFESTLDQLVVTMEPDYIMPATVLQNACTAIGRHVHAPGLVSMATPPAVQFLYLALGSLLTMTWLGQKMNQSVEEYCGHILFACHRLCRIDTIRAAAWYHFFDREGVNVSSESKNKGMNDSNYRAFLVDLWQDKQTRYIPVIRSATSHMFDIPDMNEQSAKNVDVKWWILRIQHTFENYLKQTLDKDSSEFALALKIQQQFLHSCLGVTDVKFLQEAPLDHAYFIAAETVDEFVISTDDILRTVPDFASWIEWATDDSETIARPDMPSYDGKVWTALYECIASDSHITREDAIVDIILDRFVYAFNPADIITQRCRTRGQSELTVERLRKEGVYSTMCECYKDAMTAFKTWVCIN